MPDRVAPGPWINVLRGLYSMMGETVHASLFVLQTVHTALDRAGTLREKIDQPSQYYVLRGWNAQWHRAMQRLQWYYRENVADHQTVMEAVLWGRYPPDLPHEMREPGWRMHLAKDDEPYLEGQPDATIAAILFNQMIVAGDESKALDVYDPGGAAELLREGQRQFEKSAPGEADTFRDEIDKAVKESLDFGEEAAKIATAIMVGVVIIATVIYAKK